MTEYVGLAIAVVVIGGAIWFIRKRKASKQTDAPSTPTPPKGGGGKNVKLK